MCIQYKPLIKHLVYYHNIINNGYYCIDHYKLN